MMLVQRPIFRNSFQIRFRIAVQYQICIRNRVVINQIIQLRPLIHIPSYFILHSGAIYGAQTPSENRSSTQPVSILNAQLSSFFMSISSCF